MSRFFPVKSVDLNSTFLPILAIPNQTALRRRTLFWAIALLTSSACLGQNTELKFYEPSELSLNSKALLPHRIELREVATNDTSETLESYTYVTVDPVKQLGERLFLINWMAVTKFSTGLDLCFASLEDLSIRHRITPKGLPMGLLLESHAFKGEVNIAEANADAKNHEEEIKNVYPGVKQLHQKPTAYVKHGGHYNSIIWPYLFAAMELRQGEKFILPGFNTYSNKEYYYRVTVKEQIEYTDLSGKKHRVYEVEGVSKPSLIEAQEVKPTDMARRSVYYVSNKAPYFFGKYWYRYSEDRKKIVTRRWDLSSWQLNSVNPNLHKEELIQEWEKLKTKLDLTIPWNE